MITIVEEVEKKLNPVPAHAQQRPGKAREFRVDLLSEATRHIIEGQMAIAGYASAIGGKTTETESIVEMLEEARREVVDLRRRENAGGGASETETEVIGDIEAGLKRMRHARKIRMARGEGQEQLAAAILAYMKSVDDVDGDERRREVAETLAYAMEWR